LFERRLAVVADGRDVAAAGVLQDHAFDQVVDVLDGKGQIDASVSLHFAFALEVADAAAEQNDMIDRQLGGRRMRSITGRVPLLRRGRGGVYQSQAGTERDTAGQGSGHEFTSHGSSPPGKTRSAHSSRAPAML